MMREREVICPAGFRDRLDRALSALLPGVSRGEARRRIAAGAVFVDGRCCRVASREVGAGSRLRLLPDGASSASVPRPTLVVLARDPDILAIDKPAGMPSAPTRQGAAGTALDLLQAEEPSLRLVHRLDAGTSGVLLFARSALAATRLSRAFQEGQVRKEYLALVRGIPTDEEGRIDLPLRSGANGSHVDPNGRPAVTNWRFLGRRGEDSLLQLVPETGRMHQLRVHLAHLGWPILGDRRYGGPPARRMYLHALRLAFPHPRSSQEMILETSRPEGFDVLEEVDQAAT